MTKSTPQPPIYWTLAIAGVVAMAAVVIVTSAWTGGYFSFQSIRGNGSTDLEITVDRPIPTGLRVRYAKVLAREKDVIIANPNHPVFRKEWRDLSSEGASDSVFFAFSTEPQLFGYRTRRAHYADILYVWYQRDNRKTFREVAIPSNSERGPWKTVVPVVEP